jgi:hypothetical protein
VRRFAGGHLACAGSSVGGDSSVGSVRIVTAGRGTG